jgi:hypothetical protein
MLREGVGSRSVALGSVLFSTPHQKVPTMQSILIDNTTGISEMWNSEIRTALICGASVRIINPQDLMRGRVMLEISGEDHVIAAVKAEFRDAKVNFYQIG